MEAATYTPEEENGRFSDTGDINLVVEALTEGSTAARRCAGDAADVREAKDEAVLSKDSDGTDDAKLYVPACVPPCGPDARNCVKTKAGAGSALINWN
jgi:hypothetical protein